MYKHPKVNWNLVLRPGKNFRDNESYRLAGPAHVGIALYLLIRVYSSHLPEHNGDRLGNRASHIFCCNSWDSEALTEPKHCP